MLFNDLLASSKQRLQLVVALIKQAAIKLHQREFQTLSALAFH
jgi:hypothetical protein